ncbi:PIN domain-containing protein [Emcibacter nanhaiensis]|uniref:PIN domain-containing protein n=1 Tax=Emcibacter nanhaiensis TaxID=1505037 RepID=A0A501PN30_9PROT|nr:PIN domain-containing protein [Emcibacter nanhaiensis]TPD61910.1 PIN domain-containing protein [Emcibacter nanhaiensis]
MAFTVILDACVLYPYLLRDLLIRVTQTGLYRAKWTDKINEEWIENLLQKRPELSREKLERTAELMHQAVPDSLVEDFEILMCDLKLPDENDRHVLAAALKARADMIVTYNVKDFPKDYLWDLEIEVQHPDDFLVCQIDLNQGLVLQAIREQLADLKKPSLSADEYLLALEKRELTKTAARLRELNLQQYLMLSISDSDHTIH